MWPLERFVPYIQNPRTHPDWQIQQIANSMREFGVVNPALVDVQGKLIAGHGRILAAPRADLTHFPVIVLDHLTESQARALRIADNQIAANAGWDQERLCAELAALLEEKVDLTLLGFSELDLRRVLAEVESGSTEDDAIPESPPQVVTNVGDVWILDEHRVWCGDATSLDGVQQLLEGAAADLIFTDPPYNVGYTSTATRGARPILNDDLGEGFGRFLSDACAVMLAVAGGAIYICMSSSELHTLYQAFTRAGGHWSTFVIWAKDTFTLGRSDYQRQYEPILYGWKQGNPHFWCGARDVGDIWWVDKPRANDLHPTMKPVELVERAVVHSSQRGDLVLDLFGGSGSTLIACQKNGRRARMVELEPRYVDVMIRRWQAFSGETARLATTGDCFDEIAPNANETGQEGEE